MWTNSNLESGISDTSKLFGHRFGLGSMTIRKLLNRVRPFLLKQVPSRHESNSEYLHSTK